MDAHIIIVQVEAFTQHALLGDFGLAKCLSGSCYIGSRTMQAGTPGFQAPEQLRGEV